MVKVVDVTTEVAVLVVALGAESMVKVVDVTTEVAVLVVAMGAESMVEATGRDVDLPGGAVTDPSPEQAASRATMVRTINGRDIDPSIHRVRRHPNPTTRRNKRLPAYNGTYGYRVRRTYCVGSHPFVSPIQR
jgi:hypothetical protein